MTPVALTIAGSDSGGGAGIQGDLKTFSALEVYGTSVITALTAQNTLGVSGIAAVEPGFVRQQLDAVFADFTFGAVKIGMLHSEPIIVAVADALGTWKPAFVVVDPVMVAKSGDHLLAPEAVAALKHRILPLATVVTPNLPEAAALLGEAEIQSSDHMPALAERLRASGAKAVLLKGGHLHGPDSSDYFLSADDAFWIAGRRVPTRRTHGTGCTLSSAIAAYLARGFALAEAVRRAKEYVTAAIAAADTLAVGKGRGPVHHFHSQWHLHHDTAVATAGNTNLPDQ